MRYGNTLELRFVSYARAFRRSFSPARVQHMPPHTIAFDEEMQLTIRIFLAIFQHRLGLQCTYIMDLLICRKHASVAMVRVDKITHHAQQCTERRILFYT